MGGQDRVHNELEAAHQALIEQKAVMSRLRHDLRGALSPVMLIADRLSGMDDPVCRKSGEKIVQMVERMKAMLDATR